MYSEGILNGMEDSWSKILEPSGARSSCSGLDTTAVLGWKAAADGGEIPHPMVRTTSPSRMADRAQLSLQLLPHLVTQPSTNKTPQAVARAIDPGTVSTH